MAFYGLSRDVVENLRNKLEGIRANLLRPKPAAAAQKPYRAPTPEATQQRHSEDEGTGWVGAVVVSLWHPPLRVRSADDRVGGRGCGSRGILSLWTLMDTMCLGVSCGK